MYTGCGSCNTCICHPCHNPAFHIQNRSHWIICTILSSLTSPPPKPSFLIFFPPRFQTAGHHKSVFPLALSSHFHRFPHYSVGRSGPMSTLFIIIMSHCANRRIRPSCCLTNTFCLVQALWLLPGFSTLLCFALSQLSFSKQFLVFLSPFDFQESFGIQHVLSSKMSAFINLPSLHQITTHSPLLPLLD